MLLESKMQKRTKPKTNWNLKFVLKLAAFSHTSSQSFVKCFYAQSLVFDTHTCADFYRMCCFSLQSLKICEELNVILLCSLKMCFLTSFDATNSDLPIFCCCFDTHFSFHFRITTFLICEIVYATHRIKPKTRIRFPTTTTNEKRKTEEKIFILLKFIA